MADETKLLKEAHPVQGGDGSRGHLTDDGLEMAREHNCPVLSFDPCDRAGIIKIVEYVDPSVKVLKMLRRISPSSSEPIPNMLVSALKNQCPWLNIGEGAAAARVGTAAAAEPEQQELAVQELAEELNQQAAVDLDDLEWVDMLSSPGEEGKVIALRYACSAIKEATFIEFENLFRAELEEHPMLPAKAAVVATMKKVVDLCKVDHIASRFADEGYNGAFISHAGTVCVCVLCIPLRL